MAILDFSHNPLKRISSSEIPERIFVLNIVNTSLHELPGSIFIDKSTNLLYISAQGNLIQNLTGRISEDLKIEITPLFASKVRTLRLDENPYCSNATALADVCEQDCAPLCDSRQLFDGHCDLPCNVPSCSHDGGDCLMY